jgi:hypothetical protein
VEEKLLLGARIVSAVIAYGSEKEADPGKLDWTILDRVRELRRPADTMIA